MPPPWRSCWPGPKEWPFCIQGLFRRWFCWKGQLRHVRSNPLWKRGIFMLRLAGLLLIAACCSGAGILASCRLSNRVLALESCLSFVQALCEELRYTLARTEDLLLSLGERGRFAKLDFIGNAARLTKEGMDFPTAWHTAVDGSALPLEPEDRRVLGQVGELLGASSAEGQLAQLAQCQRLLEEQRVQAQEEKTSKGNLFRSLGMLGGAGLFILFL
ncbi:MAG: hypothetical protein DBY34_03020 [Oscillospiraceae bacterium]|nr:MAG: hypothetical protein DBY34_03020 [Oscillospiraceae bacterium]